MTAADVAFRDAEAAHAAEVERLEAARREVDKLAEQFARLDPGADDDDKEFAQLIARRDALRGRIEALAARERSAASAMERARVALAEATHAGAVARYREVSERARAHGAELDRIAVDARARLLTAHKELQAVLVDAVAGWNGLPPELRGSVSSPIALTTWGMAWIAPDRDILATASDILRRGNAS